MVVVERNESKYALLHLGTEVTVNGSTGWVKDCLRRNGNSVVDLLTNERPRTPDYWCVWGNRILLIMITATDAALDKGLLENLAFIKYTGVSRGGWDLLLKLLPTVQQPQPTPPSDWLTWGGDRIRACKLVIQLLGGQ